MHDIGVISIIRKIIYGIIGILIIIGGVSIYAYSKQQSNFAKLKEVPPVTEDILEQIAEEEIEPEEFVEEEVPASSTNGIRERIKNALNSFLHQDIKIVGIGDSLTQGVGDEHNAGGYIGILDRTINAENQIATFENFGKRGNRTDQMLVRMEEEEISESLKSADIILITIGANDIMKVARDNFVDLHYLQFARERVKYEERINTILTQMRELNNKAHIFLLGIYNPFAQYFPEIEELETIVNDWNRTSNFTTSQYEDVTFIPMQDVFDQASDNLFADDHFHPNSLGYYHMAERVLEFLTNIEVEGGNDEEENGTTTGE